MVRLQPSLSPSLTTLTRDAWPLAASEQPEVLEDLTHVGLRSFGSPGSASARFRVPLMDWRTGRGLTCRDARQSWVADHSCSFPKGLQPKISKRRWHWHQGTSQIPRLWQPHWTSYMQNRSPPTMLACHVDYCSTPLNLPSTQCLELTQNRPQVSESAPCASSTCW